VWCSRSLLLIMSSEDPIATYAAAFSAYTAATRKANSLLSYIGLHWIPRAKEERVPFDMPLPDAVIAVWRDVVLRQCIGRLLRDAAEGRSDSHATELLQRRRPRAGDARLIRHAQQRIKTEPVVFKPWVWP